MNVGTRKNFEVQQWPRRQRRSVLRFSVPLVLSDMRDDVSRFDRVWLLEYNDLIDGARLRNRLEL